MKVVALDGSGWRIPADFYDALLPELGAPDWHGRNLNALYDSLRGDINRLEPPFEVVIQGATGLSPDMQSFLTNVALLFEDARREFGADVSLLLAEL